MIKKDAYYFPHFSNARNDAKLIKVRRILGLEGYAIYFMLLEILREQKEFKYPISGIEDLSFDWHVSKEKILSVITQFELFQVDELNFFSSNLIYYLQPYLEKSARATEAAKIRWQNVKNQLIEYNNNNANAMQMQCNGNAINKSKRNKNKVKENNPLILDLIEFSKSYFDEKYLNNSAQKTFDQLLSIDKYSIDDIKKAIQNAKSNDFWSQNFLSPNKLRTKNKEGVKYIDIFLVLHVKNEDKKSNIEYRFQCPGYAEESGTKEQYEYNKKLMLNYGQEIKLVYVKDLNTNQFLNKEYYK